MNSLQTFENKQDGNLNLFTKATSKYKMMQIIKNKFLETKYTFLLSVECSLFNWAYISKIDSRFIPCILWSISFHDGKLEKLSHFCRTTWIKSVFYSTLAHRKTISKVKYLVWLVENHFDSVSAPPCALLCT